jgi:hypothetical protein
VLHKGNGTPENLIRQAWGRQLVFTQPKGFDLSRALVEYFENLLTSIISRIMEDNPESSHSEPGKKKKNQLVLQKARSVINEDVSETLLVQGFDIIFKELNRYICIMNEYFEGVDWTTYVKHRSAATFNSKDKMLDDLQDKKESSSKPEAGKELSED